METLKAKLLILKGKNSPAVERNTSSKMLVFGYLKLSVYSRVDKFNIKMSVYEIGKQ